MRTRVYAYMRMYVYVRPPPLCAVLARFARSRDMPMCTGK